MSRHQQCAANRLTDTYFSRVLCSAEEPGSLRVLLPTCSIRPAALWGLRPCQNPIWNVSSTSLESNGFH
ncbi:hypothetical protein AOLI_G00260400 [Acnodon oligacanthus]